MDYDPLYLDLYESGELTKRREALYAKLKNCDTCPRNCGAKRFQGPDQAMGFCRSSELARVAQAKPHFGEEPPLTGTRGAGTVFFSNCTGRCSFCQNYDISQYGVGTDWTPEQLADAYLDLQERGCHNIDLVTPTHYVAPIVHALELAIPRGFRLPLVYNTNAYDSVETLRLLEGIISIYLPDVKYANDQIALRYSAFGKLKRDEQSKPSHIEGGYWSAIQRSIPEMYRQVGNFRVDDDGLGYQGVLVRHLIMPNGLSTTEDVLRFLASISPNISISLMSQYYPTNRASKRPELNRRISRSEYECALAAMERYGLDQGYVQELVEFGDEDDAYVPDWNDERWAMPEHI